MKEPFSLDFFLFQLTYHQTYPKMTKLFIAVEKGTTEETFKQLQSDFGLDEKIITHMLGTSRKIRSSNRQDGPQCLQRRCRGEDRILTCLPDLPSNKSGADVRIGIVALVDIHPSHCDGWTPAVPPRLRYRHSPPSSLLFDVI